MKKLALLACSAFALASCGGSSTQSNFVVPGNMQTTLVAPKYPADSEELAAFNAINNFRKSMGLGYWQQHTLLDLAAANHMKYSIANDPTFQQDIEIEGKVDFTGTTPSQRAIKAGFYTLINTFNATDVPYAVVGEIYAQGSGANVVNSMINTIYHRSSLLAQTTRFIGIARDTTGVATPGTHWWFNHGRIDYGQYVDSNYLAPYPINQQTNVPLSMTPESPSVFSGIPNFNFATQTSSPVSISSSSSTNLTPTSFTVTQAGSSTPLTGTIWTVQNDPNLTLANPHDGNGDISLNNPPAPAPTIAAYEAYWVGNVPFLPNTTYNVHFVGSTFYVPYAVTLPVEATWSFTTGNS